MIVSLAQLKLLGRISYTTHDTLLNSLIAASEQFIEQEAEIKLTESTHTERLNGGGDSLLPTQLPVVSVTSIKDKWNSDAVPPVDTFNTTTQIRIERDGRWPPGELRWEVEYVAGYGGSITVPVGLVEIAMQLVLRAYANPDLRSSSGDEGTSLAFQEFRKSDAIAKLCDYSFRKIII